MWNTIVLNLHVISLNTIAVSHILVFVKVLTYTSNLKSQKRKWCDTPYVGQHQETLELIQKAKPKHSLRMERRGTCRITYLPKRVFVHMTQVGECFRAERVNKRLKR